MRTLYRYVRAQNILHRINRILDSIPLKRFINPLIPSSRLPYIRQVNDDMYDLLLVTLEPLLMRVCAVMQLLPYTYVNKDVRTKACEQRRVNKGE